MYMNYGTVPFEAFVQGNAADVADELSLIAWRTRRSECGGLVWGRLLRGASGPVIFVAAMTPGVGRGSAADFEIAPESYIVGQQMLRDAGFPHDLEEVGLWHSHPGYGAFLSATDEEYFHLCFPQSWKVSIVIDPIRHERAVYVKSPLGVFGIGGWRCDDGSIEELPELRASDLWKKVEDRIT
jgi:proteasome lid subunit RPN8/RPN11